MAFNLINAALLLCSIGHTVIAMAPMKFIEDIVHEGERSLREEEDTVKSLVQPLIEETLIMLLNRQDIQRVIASAIHPDRCICDTNNYNNLSDQNLTHPEKELNYQDDANCTTAAAAGKSKRRARRQTEGLENGPGQGRRARLEERMRSRSAHVDHQFGAVSDALQGHWNHLRSQQDTLLRHTELHEHHKDAARDLTDQMSVVHAHMSRMTSNIRWKVHEMDDVKNATYEIQEAITAHARSVAELTESHREMEALMIRMQEEQQRKTISLAKLEGRSNLLETSLRRWLYYQRQQQPNHTLSQPNLQLPKGSPESSMWTQHAFLPLHVNELNRSVERLEQRGFTHQKQIDSLSVDQEALKDRMHALVRNMDGLRRTGISLHALNVTVRKLMELENKMAVVAEAMLSMHWDSTNEQGHALSKLLVKTAVNASEWSDWWDEVTEADSRVADLQTASSTTPPGANHVGSTSRHGDKIPHGSHMTTNQSQDGFLASALPTGSHRGEPLRGNSSSIAWTSPANNPFSIQGNHSTYTQKPTSASNSTAYKMPQTGNKTLVHDATQTSQVAMVTIEDSVATPHIVTDAPTPENGTKPDETWYNGMLGLNPRDRDVCQLGGLELGMPHSVATITGTVTGTWMVDALARNSSIYVLKKSFRVNNMRVFDNEVALRDNNVSQMYHMPFRCTGTGHVMYNASLYCNKFMTNRIVKYSLDTGEITTRRLGRAGFNNTYPYSVGSFTDMDFAVDEMGLWLVYSEEGKIQLAYVNPHTLEFQKQWNVDFPKSEALNTFMVCGRLYVVGKDEPSRVVYVFDTFTGSTRDPGEILVQHEAQLISMMDYNPKNSKLYTWQYNNPLWNQAILYDVSFFRTP